MPPSFRRLSDPRDVEWLHHRDSYSNQTVGYSHAQLAKQREEAAAKRRFLELVKPAGSAP